MGRRRTARYSPSSSTDSSSAAHPILPSKTDLTLGLTIATSPLMHRRDWPAVAADDDLEVQGHPTSLFVKVYMEGIPIGRKLDLMALHGYDDLIRTLHFMFNTTILWAEQDGEESDWEKCQYVLTYQDREGDWLMVGDVPWEMFLTAVKRLKITQIDR